MKFSEKRKCFFILRDHKTLYDLIATNWVIIRLALYLPPNRVAVESLRFKFKKYRRYFNAVVERIVDINIDRVASRSDLISETACQSFHCHTNFRCFIEMGKLSFSLSIRSGPVVGLIVHSYWELLTAQFFWYWAVLCHEVVP